METLLKTTKAEERATTLVFGDGTASTNDDELCQMLATFDRMSDMVSAMPPFNRRHLEA